jgi:hypothetical protein
MLRLKLEFVRGRALPRKLARGEIAGGLLREMCGAGTGIFLAQLQLAWLLRAKKLCIAGSSLNLNWNGMSAVCRRCIQGFLAS